MHSVIDFSAPLDPSAPRLRHAFAAPRAVLVAHTLAEVRPVLDAVHAAAQAGQWCVGYLRYEAAAAFDPALQAHAPDGPLAWFAVHDEALPWPLDALEPTAAAARVDWHQGPPRSAFDAALARIRQAIGDGELYQVNYTAPLSGQLLQGSARELFHALQRSQPGGYAACIDGGSEQVLSVSPELFFDWRSELEPGAGATGCAADAAAGAILARPMKGTAPRGATPEGDAEQEAQLRASPKERAENVMIVDLLRNDLSRIALPHSVQVASLFATQALPTVWQMTTDVQARTRPGTVLADVFSALFPCGSVTGAPKVRAMQLICELEPAPRGIYCGAVGVVRPDGPVGPDGRYAVAATFNVPIRTVVLRATSQPAWPVAATCGVGSGITWGSNPEAEWCEWAHKRAFLERASAPFDLLETLALDQGTYRHLGDHLSRMRGAACHFGHAWDDVRIGKALAGLADQHPRGLWRVRLLVNAQGQPAAQAFALHPSATPVRLQLADRAFTAAHSEFSHYKTSRRAHYEAFNPADPAVFDTVLYNDRGEITECTRGNVAMLLGDGRWVTPPLACGLLAGVGRAVALREGRVSEAVVTLEDTPRVRAWAFLNSLRGWLSAELQALPRVP